jgi:hypothetical protein
MNEYKGDLNAKEEDAKVAKSKFLCALCENLYALCA